MTSSVPWRKWPIDTRTWIKDCLSDLHSSMSSCLASPCPMVFVSFLLTQCKPQASQQARRGTTAQPKHSNGRHIRHFRHHLLICARLVSIRRPRPDPMVLFVPGPASLFVSVKQKPLKNFTLFFVVIVSFSLFFYYLLHIYFVFSTCLLTIHLWTSSRPFFIIFNTHTFGCRLALTQPTIVDCTSCSAVESPRSK